MGFDLKSWLTGFAMGRAGISLPLASKPAAYLYNGHRLPALPQWNREVYPHAFILIPDQTLPNADYAALYVLSQPPVWEDNMVAFEEAEVLRVQITGEGQWPELTKTQTTSVMGDYVRWTNVDISDAEGTVHLAASYPVPVYEQG